MAKWDANKCGFCGHVAPDLDKISCSRCKRKGCPTCLPDGDAKPCPKCAEKVDKPTGWMQ